MSINKKGQSEPRPNKLNNLATRKCDLSLTSVHQDQKEYIHSRYGSHSGPNEHQTIKRAPGGLTLASTFQIYSLLKRNKPNNCGYGTKILNVLKPYRPTVKKYGISDGT